MDTHIALKPVNRSWSRSRPWCDRPGRGGLRRTGTGALAMPPLPFVPPL